MDREQYRYQTFISDIAGQDIKCHNNDHGEVIANVSTFLRNTSERKTLPGGAAIIGHYDEFLLDLPGILEAAQLEEAEMGFNEFSTFASEWLRL